jgi:hypothetical protein
MVLMMMRRQDHGRRPAGALDRGQDRSFFRRVDQCRLAALRIVDEDAEIVLSAHELVDLQCHFRELQSVVAQDRAASRACHHAAGAPLHNSAPNC